MLTITAQGEPTLADAAAREFGHALKTDPADIISEVVRQVSSFG